MKFETGPVAESPNPDDSHKNSDVDSKPWAKHHTLGWGVNQAAPGEQVRRNLEPYYCTLENRATRISRTHATTFKEKMDTVITDAHEMADLANDRIVIKQEGVYRVHGRVSFPDPGTSGIGYRRACINISGSGQYLCSNSDASVVTGLHTIPSVEIPAVFLEEGQTIHLDGLHTYGSSIFSGGNGSTTTAPAIYASVLSVVRINGTAF